MAIPNNPRDRDIRSNFLVREVAFSKEGDDLGKVKMFEVTEIDGDIVEMKVAPSRYIRFNFKDMKRAIANFSEDYKS